MTDLVKIALIASIAPTLAAFGSIVLGFINKRGIREVHRMVDGTLAINYQIAATSARALANLSHLPEHEALALAAETKLREHLVVLASLGITGE